MKRIAIPIFALALMFASCDKIEPDANGNYTVYAGPEIMWSEGSAVADHGHNALVEKYTGPRCSNCPNADAALDAIHESLGSRLVVMSITHYQEEPLAGLDTRTDDGGEWARYFGVSYRPTAMLNRTNVNGQWDLFVGAPAISGIGSSINAVGSEQAKVAIDVTATQTGDSTDITFNVELLADVDYPLNITLAVTEDSLKYPQLTPTGTDPEYSHNHILREVITDLWGVEVTSSASAGKIYQGRIKVALKSVEDVKNAHIVAFATDAATRQVLNCAQCEVE